MNSICRYLIPLVLLASLLGCDDAPHEPSESYTYNVYFWFPNDTPEGGVFLGQASGISACLDVAKGYARERGLESSTAWDYICCWESGGSDCREKHR